MAITRCWKNIRAFPLRRKGTGETDRWNVTLVAEPDLMNNYGLSDRRRAALSHRLVDLVMEGEDLGITFDLTLNGMGQRDNLLTLAFRPPFLAATLCLIVAMLVVGWRAFMRFGPPIASAPALAFGKGQLVRNAAQLIERSRRLHLLAEPYLTMKTARIARKLAISKSADTTPEAAIDAALARKSPGSDSYARRADAMRSARGAKELLHAARALDDIERTLDT